ncbi:MAG TPA: hypothetical protein VIR64_09685, partial [Pseudobacillus sp.]
MAYGIKEISIQRRGTSQASSGLKASNTDTEQVVKSVIASMGKSGQVDVKEVAELVNKVIEQYSK